ncbi:MAG: universal stress protein UspA [Clostridia bacterium]|nr:universal stress protein UspA [Clostridia bacterium]
MSEQKGIMVCVTGQRSCERLIMHGLKRSTEDGEKRPLFIVHSVLNGQRFMNSRDEADAIDYLFTCAQYAGAELTILRCDNVEQSLADFAHEHDVGLIVLGAPGEKGEHNGRFGRSLKELLPEIEFDVR